VACEDHHSGRRRVVKASAATGKIGSGGKDRSGKVSDVMRITVSNEGMQPKRG